MDAMETQADMIREGGGEYCEPVFPDLAMIGHAIKKSGNDPAA